MDIDRPEGRPVVRPMMRGFGAPARVALLAVLAVACAPPSDDGFGEFVLVPAGDFLMGDNFDEGNSDEIPVHAVSLDDYYIGKHKVNNGEYARFIEARGYTDSAFWGAGGFGEHGTAPDHWMDAEYRGGGLPGNEAYPVVGVSWQESMAYTSWVSARTGQTYRLPTEAEWEKAARGTTQSRYPWGNAIDAVYTSYDRGQPRDEMSLTPVGFFDGQERDGRLTQNNASPYGAMDMAGNTSEWCLDWYQWDYYQESSGSSPTGPATGTDRVLRGNGYIDSAYYQRSSARAKMGAHIKSFKVGFRWVRERQ